MSEPLRAAGRALDVQVETTVFGSEILDHPFGPRRWREEYGVTGWDDVPRYSTEIGAAWRIVEHFLNHEDQAVYLAFARSWHGQGVIASATLAATRICRAALLAIEEGS